MALQNMQVSLKIGVTMLLFLIIKKYNFIFYIFLFTFLDFDTMLLYIREKNVFMYSSCFHTKSISAYVMG